MFKKFFVILSLFFSTTAFASQVIQVVWPFNPGSAQAGHTRALIEEANKLQSTYKFVFESKPGAGGVIAANYVLNNKQPTILAATSSFFIRPNLYPDASYDVDQFRPIFGQCSSPMVLAVKKFNSLNDLKQQDRLTVGVSGLGATTHLFALELKKHFTGIEIVPFNGTPPSIVAVLGNNIDATTGFPGDVAQFVDNKDLVVLGVSGSTPVNGIPTFSSQGLVNFENLTNSFSWLGNNLVTDKMISEIGNILLKAESGELVQRGYQNDFCIDFNIDPTDRTKWFSTQKEFWKSVTTDVKLN
jgi:tripartite-type tricarboxylate transporter receptor subunit TctC